MRVFPFRNHVPRKNISIVFSICISLIVGLLYSSDVSYSSKKVQETKALGQVRGELHEASVSAQVVRVVDGDTIVVSISGEKQTVRLIGVDTPETVDPRKPVECFGKEASAFSKSLLTGQSVRLVADETQSNSDKYGRLLRYVFLPDGRLVNELLLAEGFAHEYTYSNPYKEKQKFINAQETAKQNNRGLWADDSCVTP